MMYLTKEEVLRRQESYREGMPVALVLRNSRNKSAELRGFKILSSSGEMPPRAYGSHFWEHWMLSDIPDQAKVGDEIAIP